MTEFLGDETEFEDIPQHSRHREPVKQGEWSGWSSSIPPNAYSATHDLCQVCEKEKEEGHTCLRFTATPDLSKFEDDKHDDLAGNFIIAYGFVAISGFLIGSLITWVVMK